MPFCNVCMTQSLRQILRWNSHDKILLRAQHSEYGITIYEWLNNRTGGQIQKLNR